MLTKSKDLKKDKQVTLIFIKEKVKPLKWVGWSQHGSTLLLTGLLWDLHWEWVEPEALLTKIHHSLGTSCAKPVRGPHALVCLLAQLGTVKLLSPYLGSGHMSWSPLFTLLTCLIYCVGY